MIYRNNQDIPDDVYVEYVRSLFSSAGTVVVGATIHTLLAFLAYWDSGREIYLIWAAFLLAVGLWRYSGMRPFTRGDAITSAAQARQCERKYVLRGSVQGAVLGSFSLIALAAGNGFPALAAVCANMGSFATVVGRNYGSPRMVAIFGVSFLAPLALGLFLHGQFADTVLGIIMLPFFLIIIVAAGQVRKVLLSAVVGHSEARMIAQRFDRALNTMSHGLIMLGANERVVVANERAAEMLGFWSSVPLTGRSLRALLMRCVAAGLLGPSDSQYAETQLTAALRARSDRKLLLRFSDGRYFEFSTSEGRDDLGVITFEEVTRRVESDQKIRVMARYDNLTGLANRAFFHEMTVDLLASGDRERLCGLAVFDVDDFKAINDTMGHPIGDKVLYAVAQRLSSFANDDIKVGRFGGDEFMLFANRVTDRQEFVDLLDRVFERLQGEILVAGHRIDVRISAGAALLQAADSNFDTMIVKADLALYRAKKEAGHVWRLFELEMDEEFRQRQVVKAALRSAIENKGLRVVYQPIVSLDTMRIESCEALCRWDHPELGAVPPSTFIPLAEQMGLISEVTAFVLDAAVTECVKWPERISVSVNLSAMDFRNRNIVETVKRTLARSGLAPQRLEIEVTETALLDDKATTRILIEELKALGIGVSLDDFGTGYSSLSYLHTLPLDKVKIDGSFVSDLTRNARSLELLEGIIDLSRRLGLKVTVEGVETFEQLKVLSSSARPDLVQGFLFGGALTGSGIQTMAGHVWPFRAQLRKSLAGRGKAKAASA
jgi:diguanylate cyclase (GGDEF)-like protein